MSEKSKYLDSKNVDTLNNAVSKYMEGQISSYLYKISKEFNSDIDAFGKYAVKNFLTIEEWNNYGWLDNFNKSFFDIEVKTDVKSGYILMET